MPVNCLIDPVFVILIAPVLPKLFPFVLIVCVPEVPEKLRLVVFPLMVLTAPFIKRLPKM